MDVITLTGNLLAEWTFEIDAMEAGTTHRANAMTFQVGGKGLNVARILNRFGRRTLSISFAEGPMGEFCMQWLESRQMKAKFFPLGNNVRPGLVVREEGTESGETTFLGMDCKIPASSWKSACQHVELSRPKWLAICGSIPGWQHSWYRSVELVMESNAGIRVCADTYGAPLRDLVPLPLELVKVNRSELDQLFPEVAGWEAGEAVARVRESSPVRNWIITDGPNPAYASCGDGGDYTIQPAPIKEISPTGSGDTFLAALLHQWPDAGSTEDALRFATACATASATSGGIGDFPMPVPERFQPVIS